MKTDFKEINNFKIEYKFINQSKKATIFFLHGLGANFSQFDNQVVYFKSNFNILLINLPAHGNSTILNNEKLSLKKIEE